MIRGITIKGVKSFSADAAVSIPIDHTKRVALFYGNNGAGKSAIAQVIDRNGNDRQPFADCSLSVTRQDPFQYLVYNEDFVETHFRSADGFPGIFSIGQQNAAALKEAEEKDQQRQKLEERRHQLVGLKTARENDETGALKAAMDATWKVYTDHSGALLKSHLVGYGNSKAKLFEKLQSTVIPDGKVPPTVSELQARMHDLETVPQVQKSQLSLNIVGMDEIERSGLWGKSVVGSSDSTLAPLITELGNIDWINSGKKYLTKEVCPFCQQGLPHNFKDQLARLIDDVYKQQVDQIDALKVRYTEKVELLELAVKALLANEPFAKEHAKIEEHWAKMQLRLVQNITLMKQKATSPSDVVDVVSSHDEAEDVSDALAEINKRIETFNERLRHRANEKRLVEIDFWKRMRHDHAGALAVYAAAKLASNKAVGKIDGEAEDIRKDLSAIQARLSEIRAASVGTARAVEAINKRLKAHGITGFLIKKKPGEDNLYCLERPGVQDEKYKSLSEGEKTVISFFYFVELVSGSAVADKVYPQNRKIVVIDDPISSLSQTYVYDIASIIASDVIGGDKKVAQVFVLTHSLFFHHELIKQIKLTGECQYFRVVKRDFSDVVRMEKNDIQNEYDACWQVVKDARDGHGSTATVANAMRCIFEHFFTFTEQQGDFKKALRELSDQDHTFIPISRYLDNQSHANQQNVTDYGDHDVQYYLDKFKAVFDATHYTDHYRTRMGEQAVEPVPVAGSVAIETQVIAVGA